MPAVEVCQNQDIKFGCEQSLGKGLCPNVEVERTWTRKPDGGGFLTESVTCKLTREELWQGINFRKVPYPEKG